MTKFSVSRLNIAELVKNEKKFQGFQQQLMIVLHVRQCLQYTKGAGGRPRKQIEQLDVECKFPPCQFMKVVFIHIRSCKGAENCSSEPHFL